MKKISQNNFLQLLENLRKEYAIFVPVKKNDQRFYAPYTSEESMIVGEVRPFEPLKAFFTKAREIVAEDFKSDASVSNTKPYALVGVKNCDLQGFKIQDHVYADHDYEDPFYLKHRNDNLIISSDCTCAIETCFCVALGNKPYPEKGFDLNLSPMNDVYIIEAGSEKGQAIISRNSSLFDEADDEIIKKRDEQRQRVFEEVERNIKEVGMPKGDQLKDVIENNYESEIWLDESRTCVECGACTLICPSCHCFLLYDQKEEERMERLRVWDSCMLKHYARVAGGANPRPKLWTRLRNRFEKKFYYFPRVAGTYGCTGCGRCVSACPAKIDIRKVLKRLVEGDIGNQ